MDTTANPEDICRVCRLPGTDDRPLFYPCLCTGSIRFVHQDCLMQWLRHSRKEYCELCHYKFQFASIYRADMPRWLPVNYVYKNLVQGLNHKIQKWLHLCFVIFVWLYLLPVCTYRIYGVIFQGDIWSIITLPWDIITFDNLLLECLVGLFIVFVSLLAFISLVWLKDQLAAGHGPDWLTADQQEAQRQAEAPKKENRRQHDDPKMKLVYEAHRQFRVRQNEPERKNISEVNKSLRAEVEELILELEDMVAKRFYKRTVHLRTRQLDLMFNLGQPMTHCMPILREARLQNCVGVEKWKDNILESLRRKKIIPPDIGGLPPPAAEEVDRQLLPSYRERGLTSEQTMLFHLHQDRPVPPTDEAEIREMETELEEITAELNTLSENHLIQQKKIMNSMLTGSMDEDMMNEVPEEERDLIQTIWVTQEQCKIKHDKEVGMMLADGVEVRAAYPILTERERPNWYERLTIRPNRPQQRNQAEARPAAAQPARRRPQIPPRPNIGQALVGLAREPQDPNAEALQAEQLTKMLGLDGSFQFLEHVMWMLFLMTTLLIVFGFVPSKVGQLFGSQLSMWEWVHAWNDNWKILFSTVMGYLVVLIIIVAFYYGAGAFKLARLKTFLGMAYLALKVSMLLILEVGVFPLFCGWWMDICSFSLLGASLKGRQNSLNYAPGTVMFLHWLAGMIFVFYFASFVVLLREILRPGVLWFLRNLSDQNFHPIQDMISQPLLKHMRRFLMSNIMFGVSILVLLFIPSRLITFILPRFLPYNLTLMSTVSPIREVQLELILLQFVIPTLLEHSNARAAIKTGARIWSNLMAKLLGLESYLLDKPQSGGVVVDMHGNVIRELPFDPDWNGPAFTGPNEVMGPGFAPFKPYLRGKYFPIRVIGLICFTIVTILCVSVALLLLPVLLGRLLMAYIGLLSPSDIYTAAIGFYVLWVITRATTAIAVKMCEGILVVIKQLALWLYQGLKCCLAAFLLFAVIPLLLGNLINLLVISPIRVPMNKTPIIYFSTEWALGLLQMKCLCGIIWLTDTSFKRTLDQLYQRGVRNMSLSFVVTQVAWPVISYLFLFISVPYVLCMTLLYKTGLMEYSTSFIWYRYCYAVFFVVLISLSVLIVIMKQSSRIYSNIRNKEYLIGRQLVNYGTAATEEVTPLAVPEQETGHD